MNIINNALQLSFPVGNHRCFKMFCFCDLSLCPGKLLGLLIFSAKNVLWGETVHDLWEPMTTTLRVIRRQILATISAAFNCSPCLEKGNASALSIFPLHLRHFMCLWSWVKARYGQP